MLPPRERKNKKKYGNRSEVGLDSVKPLQGLTTKLSEARGGELNAATALRKLRLTLERALIRVEVDVQHATNANAKRMSLRKALRDTERECESEGGLWYSPNVPVCCSVSIGDAKFFPLLPHVNRVS